MVSGSCGFSVNLVTRFQSVTDSTPKSLARVARHLDHADRDVGALLDVVGDHRTVVHLVDVIAGQHQHVLGPQRADQIQVLVDAIGGAAIPVHADLLLRRHHVDELAELAAQVAPAALHVLDQRLTLVLRHQIDLADAGIDAVRQHEIDDAEFAAERRRRLAAMQRQILEPLAAAAGHDHGQRAAGQTADVASGGSARLLLGHSVASGDGRYEYSTAHGDRQPHVHQALFPRRCLTAARSRKR